MASRTEIGNGDESAETMGRTTSKLSEGLSKTARDSRVAAGELATAVQHSAEEIRERTAEFGNRAAKSVREAGEGVQKVAREHPLAAAAAAAGAGALIGLFLARRR